MDKPTELIIYKPLQAVGAGVPLQRQGRCSNMNPPSVSLRSSQSKAAVPSSPKLRLQQREQINPTAHAEPTADPLKPLLRSYRRRVRSWRVQPNWLPSDWFEEIEATQAIAAWQAGRAYDPSSGLQYEVFVYQEVMAPALARYRQ